MSTTQTTDPAQTESPADPIATAAQAVTDADTAVSTAEQEAADTAELVTRLRARVADGDDEISADEVEQARALSEHAQLRAQGARVKADAARREHRRAHLAAVAEQMRAHHSDAARIAELMDQLTDAATGILEACAERSRAMDEWRRTMHEQDVAQLHGENRPARDDAGVGWRSNGYLLVDGRTFEPPQPGNYLVAALSRALRATGADVTYNGSALSGRLGPVDEALAADPATQLARYL